MNKKDILILPLQFFGDAEGEKEEKAEEKSEKTFTQSDLDSAISKAVDSYSKRKEKEFEDLMKKAVQEGVAKEKTYSQLTEEQKKEKDLEEKLKKLTEKENELNRRERYSGIVTDLQTNGLPLKLADYLVDGKPEQVKQDILDLKKLFDDAVNEKVNETIKGTLRQGDPKEMKGSKGKSLAEIMADKKNKQAGTAFDPWSK